MMKKIKYIIAGVLVTLTVVVYNSCVKNELELFENAKSGYLVTMSGIESFVSGTWDLGTKTIIYDSVYFYGEFIFPDVKTSITNITIRKVLYDDFDNLLGVTVLDEITQLPDTILYEYNSKEDLFDGLSYPADSLKPDYYFQIITVALLPSGDTLVSNSGIYNINPSLSGFCPLPDLPPGIYTAKNNLSAFSCEAVIRKPSPFVEEDDGRFWLSNFGLDWSTWNDVWYSIEFKLNCPKGSDPRYVIELLPGGNWNTGVAWTAVDRTGSEVTKDIRIMPYMYAEDTESIGYYDPDKQEIEFKNVSVIDTWWNIDNHTIDISFKFKEPEPGK